MLKAHKISHSFEIEPILVDVDFSIGKNQRVGLVGPNGCGKSTLMRILAGLQIPDFGSVQLIPSGLSLGYLPQGFNDQTHLKLIDYLQAGLPFMDHDPEMYLSEISQKMMLDPNNPELTTLFDKCLQDIELKSSFTTRLESYLHAMGLGEMPIDLPFQSLSGGQKTRAAMVRLLLSQPDLLLLDEPTNHLDFHMLEWLENWLVQFQGGILFVSHDRIFLDRVATHILELDHRSHTTHVYTGNYSTYLEEKQREREQQSKQYQDQQDELFQLKQSAAHLRGIAKFKKGGKGDSGDKFARGFFANRSLGTVGRAKHIEKRIQKILTEDKIDKPPLEWEIRLDLKGNHARGKMVLETKSLTVGYPGKILISDLDITISSGKHIGLIGPNGSGKTTLIRTIAGQCPPLSGEVRLGVNVKMGTMTQEQENLPPEKNAVEIISEFMNASLTDTRSFLSKLLFTGDEVFRPVKFMSYGERARLSLACLIAQGCDFLILDEPINHLDIPSRERIESTLEDFQGTVLSAVHDRFYLANLATEVWKIENQSIRVFERTDLYGVEQAFKANS